MPICKASLHFRQKRCVHPAFQPLLRELSEFRGFRLDVRTVGDPAKRLIQSLLRLRAIWESAFPLLHAGGRSVLDVVDFAAPDDGTALPAIGNRP